MNAIILKYALGAVISALYPEGDSSFAITSSLSGSNKLIVRFEGYKAP